MAANGLPLFPRFTGLILRFVARCTARVRVEGLDNFPRTGAALVICNHCSNADGTLMMAYVVPAIRRKMGWLGKEESMHWPFAGWAMRQNGVFGVRRGAGVEKPLYVGPAHDPLSLGPLRHDDPLYHVVEQPVLARRVQQQSRLEGFRR